MNVQFTSLHGTTLSGKVAAEKKMKGQRIYFVFMLHKIFAICDGYSVDEAADNTDQKEFEASILCQL